jgi:hypothetical protein
MAEPRITFGTKAQSKEESLLKDMERSPAERIKLFLEMSEFYLKLYPPPKSEPDYNFHIYRDEH